MHRTLPLAALAAAVLGGTASTPTTSRAQRPVRAATVAAQVQAFHDQTRTLEARFYQTYYHRLYGRYQRSRGRLAFDKPGRMRFDYAHPNGKVIVSDGRMLTAYDPAEDGARGQYVETPVRDAALPAAFGFLTGSARLGDGYRLRLLDSRAWGFSGHVLELRPRRPDPRYRRILLFVDARPELAGVVHRIRIDDHDGNRNKFELSRMRFNREVDSDRFAWRPPRDARRIRM